MRRVTHKQYLALFDPTVHVRLAAHMRDEETLAAVCYEVQDFCSSHRGERAHLPVGPRWTLKTLEDTGATTGELGRPLGDVPSRFKYPTYYWQKPVTEEDSKWEEFQDQWDREHPSYDAFAPRDDAAADRFTNDRLASWQSKSGKE